MEAKQEIVFPVGIVSRSLVAGHQHPQERHRTFFAASQKSLMAAAMSFRLYCSLISNIASLSFHSFTEPKVHSQPSYLLARYATGCVTDFCCRKPALISCHAKILHCAIWRYPALSNCPIRWHSLETRIRLVSFLASGFFKTAMKNCSLDRLCYRRRRFYLSAH